MNNTSPSGSLDTDKFQKAMLAYRNTIDPETKASPAMIIFGRPIRDAIPIPLGKYCPHPTWSELMAHRENALAKRHTREHEKWEEHTRALPPLKVGDAVFIQNLTGNYPKRWERTGVVVEVRQFHQYVVRVDGSGRISLRNRQHLRRYTPFRPALTGSPQSPLPPTTFTRPQPCPVPDALEPSRNSHPSGDEFSSPSTPTAPSFTLQAPAAPDHPPSSYPAMESTSPLGATASGPPSGTAPVTMPAMSSLTDPLTMPEKLPRAVMRLLPHNTPGLTEPNTGRRRRAQRPQMNAFSLAGQQMPPMDTHASRN